MGKRIDGDTMSARFGARRWVAMLIPAIALMAALAAFRVNITSVLARHEPADRLVELVGSQSLRDVEPAAIELLERLCDGRVKGDSARDAAMVLWPPRVTPDPLVNLGSEFSIGARLVSPRLPLSREDGPKLSWRLVQVRIDGGDPILFDAPPTEACLAERFDSARSDSIRLPSTSAVGVSHLSCEYEYVLNDAAGSQSTWRSTFDREIHILPSDPPSR